MKKLLCLWYLAFPLVTGAQTKISELLALPGAEASPADVLPVVDVSAGVSGSKKITLAELFSTTVPWTGVPIGNAYIASAASWNAKEGPISPGTTGQYWRGDKSWQALNKGAVGLGNVDNTADADKPVSDATQEALDGKLSTNLSNADNAIINGAVMPRTIRRFQDQPPNAPSSFVAISAGDSFAPNLAPMERLLGRNCGYGGSTNAVFTFYGNAAALRYPTNWGSGNFDFTRSPTGNYWRIGAGQTVILSPGEASVYMNRVHVFYTKENGGGTFKVEQNVGAGWVPMGIAQQINSAAAGTIGTNGNLQVTVTGAAIVGSPLVVSVPVIAGDTAATWANKVRVALQGTAAITNFYTVSGGGGNITLNRNVQPYGNDPTLNVALANGTATGITPVATSTVWVQGYAGIDLINTNNGGAITPDVATQQFVGANTTMPYSTLRQIRITGVSGISAVWGFCASDKFSESGMARGGYEAYLFGQDGLPVSGAAGVQQAFFDVLYGTLKPDVVTFKADDGTVEATLPTWVDKVRAARPGGESAKPDFFFIGAHPTANPANTTDLTMSTQDLELVKIANDYGGTYVNSRQIFRSRELMLDLGLYADGLHLADAANVATVGVIADAIWRRLGSLQNLNRPVMQQKTYGYFDNWTPKGSNYLMRFRSFEGNGNGNDVFSLKSPDDAGFLLQTGTWNEMQFYQDRWLLTADNAQLGNGFTYDTTNYGNAGFTVLGGTGSDTAVGSFIRRSDGTNASTPVLEARAGSTPTRRWSVLQNGTTQIEGVGGTVAIKSGTNAKIGTGATLSSGVVTIANTSVTANSHIMLTKTAQGGTAGDDYVVTKAPGASFTITAKDKSNTTVTTDTSSFDWIIVERIP